MDAGELSDREYGLAWRLAGMVEAYYGVRLSDPAELARAVDALDGADRDHPPCRCPDCRRVVAAVVGQMTRTRPRPATERSCRGPGVEAVDTPGSVAEVEERLAPAGTAEAILASYALSVLHRQGVSVGRLADARRAGAAMADMFLQRNGVAHPATGQELVRELRRRVGEAQPKGHPPGPATETELLLAEVVLRTLAREGVTHSSEAEVAASAYGVAALAPVLMTTDRQRQFVKHLGTALAAARKAGGR